MSLVLVDEQVFYDIADAIRALSSTDATFKKSEMAPAILGMSPHTGIANHRFVATATALTAKVRGVTSDLAVTSRFDAFVATRLGDKRDVVSELTVSAAFETIATATEG